jgi:hypothetical protein
VPKKILVILACGLPILCAGVAGAAESAAGNPVVLMETSMGNVKLELFAMEGADLDKELPGLCQQRLL